VFNFGGGTEKKSMYLILIHMALPNMIMLFSKEMLKIIAAFGLRNFLNDTGHKKECRVPEEDVQGSFSLHQKSLHTGSDSHQPQSFRVGESQAEVCMTHPSIVGLV
jgi:hypothetical protein